jgi:citronellol/citronellal dehydrogenase
MLMNMSRKPEILADAAYYILQRASSSCTGNFFIDEEVLAAEGVTDLSSYAVVPGAQLYTDLFL